MNPSYVDAALWGKPGWWRYLLGIAIVIVFWLGMGGVFTMMLMLAFNLSGADLSGGDYTAIIGSLTPVQAYLMVNASFLFLLAGTVFAVMTAANRLPIAAWMVFVT